MYVKCKLRLTPSRTASLNIIDLVTFVLHGTCGIVRLGDAQHASFLHMLLTASAITLCVLMCTAPLCKQL